MFGKSVLRGPMSRTTDMTTGNSAKHILRFAFPLILTNIGQQLYMIADAAIVGESYLFLMCICMPILYSIHIFRNGLQAIGISIWSMISGIAEFIVRVTLSKAVILWLGTNTLFFVEPSAWFSAFLVLALPYFINERRLLKRTVPPLEKQLL